MKKGIFNALFAIALALSLSLVTARPVAAAIINVPGDKPTIQAAITAAAAGDTINVAAGTYHEEITINKPLTVNGEDGAILEGSPTLLTPPKAANAWTTGVKIKSGDVAFINIDVTNFTQDGIIVGYEASIPGSLKNVHITNCKVSNIQPGNWGFGIYAGYEAEAFKYVPPKLTAHLDYSGLLIEGNEIENAASSSLVLQSITGTPGTLVVRNNYIHDGENDGIWMDCARNIVIKENVVSSNADGLYISSYGDAFLYKWVYDWSNQQLNGPYGPMNIEVTGNQIVDSKLYGGVYLQAGYPATMRINENVITGNAPGVANYLAEQVNATCNWWGAATGPTHASNPLGTGDAVSDNVAFLPWLSGPLPEGECIGGSAMGWKKSVLDDLTALRASITDPEDHHKLNEAINHLTKSLNPKWWVDDSHLSTKDGGKVFDEEKAAVGQLRALRNDKNSTVPDAPVQSLIDRLIDADRLLAVVAIAGSTKKPTDIAKANEELAKGDNELAKGRYDHAIDHYKNAWQIAT